MKVQSKAKTDFFGAVNIKKGRSEQLYAVIKGDNICNLHKIVNDNGEKTDRIIAPEISFATAVQSMTHHKDKLKKDLAKGIDQHSEKDHPNYFLNYKFAK